jgi:hypothetical protein
VQSGKYEGTKNKIGEKPSSIELFLAFFVKFPHFYAQFTCAYFSTKFWLKSLRSNLLQQILA